ncbi:MAG: outer membrane beta-barrel protein [Bacteroidales bacterium]|nr:outer membrane beta-barrel protein [Bacteroidales bacterium]
MKNFTLTFTLLLLFGLSVYAQNLELKVEAGSNLTFIPDFIDDVIIANDGLIVPGLITPANSLSPLIWAKSFSETKTKPGFYVDVVLDYKFAERWKLFASAGLSYWRYDYDTYIDTEETTTFYLSEIDPNHGNTSILYYNIKPVSFSYEFIVNRLFLHGGPSFNYLIAGDFSKTVLISHTETFDGKLYEIVDRAYFKSTEEMNTVLIGFDLGVDIKIIRQLYLAVSGQYYFNSVYYTGNSYKSDLSNCNPLQLQVGLNYQVFDFNKR